MKKITAIAFKKEGEDYQINNENFFKKQLNSLPPGKYLHTVEKYYRKATPAMFGYLYGVIYPLSLIALNNAGYEFTEIDEVDDFWKMMFANKKVLNRETGEIMLLPMSKAEFLTIDEMTYADAIRNYCSDYLCTSIPDPDPRYKQKRNDTENKSNI